jgi:hypothetical protein
VGKACSKSGAGKRPNRIVIVTGFVGGLSVASAIFLILEMGQPFAGLMRIAVVQVQLDHRPTGLSKRADALASISCRDTGSKSMPPTRSSILIRRRGENVALHLLALFGSPHGTWRCYEDPSGPITVPHHTALDAHITIVRHEACPVDVFFVELVKAYFPRLLIRNFFLGG